MILRSCEEQAYLVSTKTASVFLLIDFIPDKVGRDEAEKDFQNKLVPAIKVINCFCSEAYV